MSIRTSHYASSSNIKRLDFCKTLVIPSGIYVSYKEVSIIEDLKSFPFRYVRSYLINDWTFGRRYNNHPLIGGSSDLLSHLPESSLTLLQSYIDNGTIDKILREDKTISNNASNLFSIY